MWDIFIYTAIILVVIFAWNSRKKEKIQDSVQDKIIILESKRIHFSEEDNLMCVKVIEEYRSAYSSSRFSSINTFTRSGAMDQLKESKSKVEITYMKMKQKYDF